MEKRKIINKIEKELMKKLGGIRINKDYPIKEILSIMREKDKFKVSFVLMFRMESYGRGYSRKLFIQRIESQYPYTCLTYTNSQEKN